jgi:two-component system cell cycle sensor histidine kinase/response regulator CckA
MPSFSALVLSSILGVALAALFLGWTYVRSGRGAPSTRSPAPAPVDDGSAAFQLLADCSSDLVLLVDAGGRIVYASPSTERAFAARLAEIRGQPFMIRTVKEDRSVAEEMLAVAHRDGSARGTLHVILPGRIVRAYDTLVDATRGGEPGVLVVSGRDVTEQLLLAGQLRQAQKMEAVGRLAAGVAHDFNNMIAVIRSGTELARDSLPPGHPAHADLADVACAADRGAAITRQLLSFARVESAGARRTDVALVFAEMARFVPRLMGRGIQVRFVEGATLGEVPLSATALEQVILNLVLNARDAMPSGGWITVEARRVDLRSREGTALSPGPHVEISVRDQGTGMSDEVRRRLFEPFFTTKVSGMGSGLGLATSREIVEGGGGAIEVDTEEGRGSVIRVLLPRLALATGLPALAVPEPGVGRRSRILLVDHDPALVALLSRLLAARGHEVIVAASPLEARQQAASFPGAVDVILTGLDLGRDHGVTVLGEVRRTSPRARAILLSGEVRDPADVDHLLEAGVELVRRPVPPEALVEAVERAAARAPILREPAVA